MMLIATLTAALVTKAGRSAWFVGVLILMVYVIFAMTLYLLPPRISIAAAGPPDSLAEKIMLRQFLLGGGVSAINIAIHSLMMAILVGLAQTASAKKRLHPSCSSPP